MPVISVKARASVLDSYSWVVMVSDTTLISLTPLALSLAAASMNHCISAICLSLDSVDGWNSESTHFSASGTPAHAADHPIKAMLAAMTCKRNFMTSSSLYLPVFAADRGLGRCRPAAVRYSSLSACLSLAHDPRQQQHRSRETDPHRGRIVQREPVHHLFAQAHIGQVDPGRGHQADEQAVAARGGNGQK